MFCQLPSLLGWRMQRPCRHRPHHSRCHEWRSIGVLGSAAARTSLPLEDWAISFGLVPGRATPPRAELSGAYLDLTLRPNAAGLVADANDIARDAPAFPPCERRLRSLNGDLWAPFAAIAGWSPITGGANVLLGKQLSHATMPSRIEDPHCGSHGLAPLDRQPPCGRCCHDRG